MAIFQTFSYKRRKQQNDVDSMLLLRFAVNFCSTIGTILFGTATFLTIYIYFVYKTQNVVKVLPPFGELGLIKVFFILAFILKVSHCIPNYIIISASTKMIKNLQAIKFGHHLSQQIDCDIFFIDWERPRVFEHQITLKSTNNLDTPSICSSVCISSVRFVFFGNP